MWIPKDAATWLALIALILVVPFNFFSTWAYPKLQNWWAARSRKSLKKRIDKLTASLADMDESRVVSLTNEWVLICAEQLGSLIFWSVNLLVLVILFLTTPPDTAFGRHPKVLGFIFAVVMSIYRIVKEFLMAKIRRFRLFGGPMRRLDLELSIEDLTAKLAAREGHKTT